MFRFCINFLVGLSCLFWIENNQQAILLCIVSAIALTISIYTFHHIISKNSELQKFNKITSVLIALTFGLVWGSSTVIYWLETVPRLITEPKVVRLQGYICSIPHQHNSQKISFDFCINKFDDVSLSLLQKNKIKLNKYYPSNELSKEFLAGTFWNFKVKLKPIHGRLNPGGFDYEKWLLSDGFIATGYIREETQLIPYFSLSAKYHSLRQAIYRDLMAVVPQSENKGIVLALAMGERSAISAEQWQAVQGSGTSHLLAISGLHIGIAALWSYYLFLLIFKPFKTFIKKIPAQRIAQIGSLVGATSIALLSGFGYPAQRALIMLSVYLVAQWSGRTLSLSKTLILSIVVIATLQPLAILTVSFWLSISAVAIIVLLTSYKQSSNGIGVGFKGWLRINWFLFVGLMPLTWAIFDSVSLVGFIANIILIPLTSFLTTPIIYVGLIGLSISDTLAHWLFVVADELVDLTYQIQYMLSQVNDTTSVSSLPMAVFILLLASILVLLMPAKLPGKTILLPLIIAGFMIYTTSSKTVAFKMVVFDIGQGLAIHIQVEDSHLLFDTGYGNGQFSMAQTSLLPYFNREGIKKLDFVVVSHADSDHAGGLTAINKKLRIGEIISGEPLDFETSNCHSRRSWRWQQAEFEFISHLPVENLEGNNASCVLLITIFEQRILLTGDIEKRAEQELVANDNLNKLKDLNLLVSPHHGSLTSSTVQMVNYLKPDFVIHSAGYANQWGFPRQEVVKRYLSVDAKNYMTHRDGAITIRLDKFRQLDITTERTSRSHFWY